MPGTERFDSSLVCFFRSFLVSWVYEPIVFFSVMGLDSIL